MAVEYVFEVKAYRSGLSKKVTVEWERPYPVAVNGKKVVSYDKAVAFHGPNAISVKAEGPFGNTYKADGEEVLSKSWSFPYLSYWGYAGVPNSETCSVPYGEAVTFSVVLNCSFPSVELEGGSVLRDVKAEVRGSTVYRQPDDTKTFASENAKVLFWPYQDVR